jgi:hypothetical protein
LFVPCLFLNSMISFSLWLYFTLISTVLIWLNLWRCRGRKEATATLPLSPPPSSFILHCVLRYCALYCAVSACVIPSCSPSVLSYPILTHASSDGYWLQPRIDTALSIFINYNTIQYNTIQYIIFSSEEPRVALRQCNPVLNHPTPYYPVQWGVSVSSSYSI